MTAYDISEFLFFELTLLGWCLIASSAPGFLYATPCAPSIILLTPHLSFHNAKSFSHSSMPYRRRGKKLATVIDFSQLDSMYATPYACAITRPSVCFAQLIFDIFRHFQRLSWFWFIATQHSMPDLFLSDSIYFTAQASATDASDFAIGVLPMRLLLLPFILRYASLSLPPATLNCHSIDEQMAARHLFPGWFIFKNEDIIFKWNILHFQPTYLHRDWWH